MEVKLFEEIYNNLMERANWCDTVLGPIKSKSDLENISVKQYLEMKDKCKTLLSDMDKIYTEFEHIIGMGNLTVQQQSKLLSAMRKFTNYRSDIKCIAAHSDANSVPTLPGLSTYQLSVLSNTTLVRGDRGQDVVVKKDKGNNKLPYIYYLNQNKTQMVLEYCITNAEQKRQIAEDFAIAFGEVDPTFYNNMSKLGNHNGLVFTTSQKGSTWMKTILECSCVRLKPIIDYYKSKLEEV